MNGTLPLRAVTGEIDLPRSLPAPTPRVTLRDHALAVMTDLRQVPAITVEDASPIDEALQHMACSGVRLAFAAEGPTRLSGLITSYDIQGEKPIRYLQSLGCIHKTCSRRDVLVRHIMEPTSAWQVLSYGNLYHATVADMVAIFKAIGRAHVVVVEPSEESGRHVVRGLFSASQLGRQLGMTMDVPDRVVTFVEIEQTLNHDHGIN